MKGDVSAFQTSQTKQSCIPRIEPEVMQRPRTNIFDQAQRPNGEKKRGKAATPEAQGEKTKEPQTLPDQRERGSRTSSALQKKMYTCQSPTYMLPSPSLQTEQSPTQRTLASSQKSGVPVPVNASLRRKEQLKQFPRNRTGAQWTKAISTSTSPSSRSQPRPVSVQSRWPSPVHVGADPCLSSPPSPCLPVV